MTTYTPTPQTCSNLNDGTIQLAGTGGTGELEYGVRKLTIIIILIIIILY